MNGADLTVNRTTPVADFTSLDFDAFMADFRAYIAQKYDDATWPTSDDDLVVITAEGIAYFGDLLSYSMNASVREAFWATALRRENVVAGLRPYGITLPEAESATADVVCTLDPAATYPRTLYKDQNQFTNGGTGDALVIFQPVADVVVPAYPPGGVIVPSIEGELFVSVLVGVGTGKPNQRWQLPQQGVVLGSISVRVNATPWTPLVSLVASQSSDTHYRILQKDTGDTYLVFGDGVYGAVPAIGQEIRATFRVGGGRRGNLPEGIIRHRLASDTSILSVTNPAASSGGLDARPLKTARDIAAADRATQDRCVTSADYGAKAATAAGVAKARVLAAYPRGSRGQRVIVAAAGGGAVSSTMKNAVLASFAGKSMLGDRQRVYSATYRDVRFHVLLHVSANYVAAEVEEAIRRGILNDAGTGLLDFDQLDFEAVRYLANGEEEFIFSQMALQEYFSGFKRAGLERAEILRLDCAPIVRPRETGNYGTGTVGDVTLNSRQRRRQYRVQLVSATQAHVFERIVGRVSYIGDNSLSDDARVYDEEGVTSYAGWRLQPSLDISSTFPVLSASGQTVTIPTNAGSMFALTSHRAEYALFSPTPTVVSVGSTYTSADGSVKFKITAGSTPFISSDTLDVDVFPVVGDLRVRPDEYPVLSNANFVTRVSGGARI